MSLARDETFKVPKNYTYGTHRLYDPALTLQTISAYFSTMEITRIADVTGLDVVGIPVCVAVRPNSQSLSVSQGKGLTLTLAKVSAAMETIELYHAENMAADIFTGSYHELSQTSPVCNPHDLTLLADANYDHNLPLHWVKGVDLVQENEIWVPYDLVHCLLDPQIVKNSPFPVSSNGLASGNHLLEAISHAICEVIERDAIYFWELRSQSPHARVPYINLDTVHSPPCRELLQKLAAAGLDVYVWDLESRTGIPVLGCAIVEKRGTLSLMSTGIFHGFGCHLSKEIAFIRAVTEAAQTRLTYISGARDDIYREWYETTQSEFFQAQWKQFLNKERRHIHDFNTYPSLETESLEADVSTQLRHLQMAGLDQVVVIDLSQPGFEIAVARVIIPGMHLSMHSTVTKLGQRMRENGSR